MRSSEVSLLFIFASLCSQMFSLLPAKDRVALSLVCFRRSSTMYPLQSWTSLGPCTAALFGKTSLSTLVLLAKEWMSIPVRHHLLWSNPLACCPQSFLSSPLLVNLYPSPTGRLGPTASLKQVAHLSLQPTPSSHENKNRPVIGTPRH